MQKCKKFPEYTGGFLSLSIKIIKQNCSVFCYNNKFDIASNALNGKTQYFFYYFSPMKMRYVFFTLMLTENYLLQSIPAVSA